MFFFLSYSGRHWLAKKLTWFWELINRILTGNCPGNGSKTPKISNQNYFQIRLPRTMDFDGAIVTITIGGKRMTQINPQYEGRNTGQILHFDLGDQGGVDTVEIYTPRDDKKYDFLEPVINTVFEMEPPLAYFEYYDPEAIGKFNCPVNRTV